MWHIWPKFWFQIRKGPSKNFLWPSRLWVLATQMVADIISFNSLTHRQAIGICACKINPNINRSSSDMDSSGGLPGHQECRMAAQARPDSRGTHWKKKWSHFDLKSWVTGGSKIRPGIPTNWRIFESNWLDIESQLSIWLKNSPITWNPRSNFSSASDSTF